MERSRSDGRITRTLLILNTANAGGLPPSAGSVGVKVEAVWVHGLKEPLPWNAGNACALAPASRGGGGVVPRIAPGWVFAHLN